MAIQLNLAKPKVAPVVMTLNKVSRFTAKLFWDSKHDCDVHLLALDSNGSIDDDASRILSTYNPACVLQSNTDQNILAGTKKPFQNPQGYLLHNGDKRDGLQGDQREPDEVVEIDLEVKPKEIVEVAFVVSIHPPSTATFSEVRNARIVIEDDNGKVLIEGALTSDFDQYHIVKIGSIKEVSGNWAFNAQAIGYDKGPDGTSSADLNTVIADHNS